MKKVIRQLTVILMLAFWTVTNCLAQIDTTFWNPSMIAIAKPTSKSGWIHVRNGINIMPNNLFIGYKMLLD